MNSLGKRLTEAARGKSPWLRTTAMVATVLLLLFIFLVGIKGLGGGFKLLGKDLLGSFFAATESPFIALVVGILATTLVQSSSVTTAMIVGLVAAPENPLPLQNAIPMIMGANIGTTVTNSIASLAHIGRRDEFVRAFSVATCHDFFNFMAVAALLPLELATGLLERTAGALAAVLGSTGAMGAYKSPLKVALKAAVAPLKAGAAWLFEAKQAQAVALILVSAVLIFVALALVVRVMRAAVQTRVEVYLTRFLSAPAPVAMALGAVVTVMVQSSSITTSLLVPLAGAGLLNVRQAFPITLGANIGTTVTALLASLAVSGPHAAAGVQIALVHLLFNLIGTVMVYPVAALRRLPVAAAQWLAETSVTSRRWALGYVVGLFYGLPALLVFVEKVLAA